MKEPNRYCPDCDDAGEVIPGIPTATTDKYTQYECPECGLTWAVKQGDADGR